MADKEIRIGVIGTGIIGKKHLETYAKVPGARIVAICDLIEPEIKRLSELYKIESTYTEFRKLLAREDIDAVDVCLHNNLHMPVTTLALKAGKHVYCEKPMAGSYADAATMYETAKKTGRKLSIQLSTLFSKETRVAKALIDHGQLGKIYHARSTGFRRRGRPFVDGYATPAFVSKTTAGGGALYDMGVYHISVMLHLLGNPKVMRVTGKTYQETDMDAARRKSSGYDVEELGLGFVRFDNNATLDIIESWAIHLDNFESPSIVGSQAGLRLQPLGLYHNVGDMEVATMVNVDNAVKRWQTVKEIGDGFDSAQHHWVRALQGKVELLPTAELALNTMLISEAIYLSEKLGREVTAEEVAGASKSTAVQV